MTLLTVSPIKAFNDNYIWLIIDIHQKRAICIDPGSADEVIDVLQQNQLDLSTILITHHHYDHTGGIHQLKQLYPNASCITPEDKRISISEKQVKESDIVNCDSLRFTVIETPGHTLTHICYYEANQGWLFCGDTLFSGGCGRLFEGTAAQMRKSLSKLCQLPATTKVFCAHEYTRSNLRFAQTIDPLNTLLSKHLEQLTQHPEQISLPSTIGLEQQINPFLRWQDEQIKLNMKKHNPSAKNDDEIFATIRKLKDQF